MSQWIESTLHNFTFLLVAGSREKRMTYYKPPLNRTMHALTTAQQSTNLDMFFFSVPLTALILSRDALLIGYAFYLRFKSLPSPVSMICTSKLNKESGCLLMVYWWIGSNHMFPKLEIFVIIMCILCCCITFKCVKGFYGFYWNNKTDEMAINRLGDHPGKEKHRA